MIEHDRLCRVPRLFLETEGKLIVGNTDRETGAFRLVRASAVGVRYSSLNIAHKDQGRTNRFPHLNSRPKV